MQEVKLQSSGQTPIGHTPTIHRYWGNAMHKIGCSLALAIALVAASGCDSKSNQNTGRSVSQPPGMEIPPPRDIPDESLPFDEDELNVAAAFPGPGENRIALVSPISVEFDDELLTGQNLAQAIRVTTSNGSAFPGAVSQSASDTLIFRPTGLWAANTRYTIAIDSALISSEGRSVAADLGWGFTTIADVHTTPQSVIDLCMSDADVEMLATVNRVRTSARSCRGVPYPAVGKLTWNCLLQEAAVTHSQDMATNDFFEHAGSDGSNHTQRIARTGYLASATGENLAAGYRTLNDAVEGLLASTKGHCEILMQERYTEFGSGYAVNPDSEYQRYWTQNFARPR
jgi:Uncharacterized protein with SCP/PR1 domains